MRQGVQGNGFLTIVGGINTDADVGLFVNKGTGIGNTFLEIGGPNCTLKNGTSDSSNPLGTPNYNQYRGGVGNGNYIGI